MFFAAFILFYFRCVSACTSERGCEKGKGSPYSITECRVPELIPVLGSQPAGDVCHKRGLKRAATNFVNRGTMGVNSLPKTVTRQRRSCDFNPGPSAPESSILTTRLPSHPYERGVAYGNYMHSVNQLTRSNNHALS